MATGKYQTICALALVLTLGGCGALRPAAMPFGTEIMPPSIGTTYEAETRADLIVWCHDYHGYISEDGLNCVWSISPLNWYTSTPDCVKGYVKDMARDERWTGAICSGTWRPKLEIG